MDILSSCDGLAHKQVISSECTYASLLVVLRKEQTSPSPSTYRASVHTAEQHWSMTAASLRVKLNLKMHESCAPYMLAPGTSPELVGSCPAERYMLWMWVPSTCGLTSTSMAPHHSLMEIQPVTQLHKKDQNLGKQLFMWLFLPTYEEKMMLELCELG